MEFKNINTAGDFVLSNIRVGGDFVGRDKIVRSNEVSHKKAEVDELSLFTTTLSVIKCPFNIKPYISGIYDIDAEVTMCVEIDNVLFCFFGNKFAGTYNKEQSIFTAK